jgi:mRNA interferase MazF
MIGTIKNGNGKRFEIYLVDLNPTRGSEIFKTKPAIVVSPNEMNKYLNTIIIAPDN